jgi:hypothetical protein
LMGRGLVDPVDDFRASNPASHPGLLNALADDLAGHGFDLRHLIRTIVSSRVYQLDWEPNESNGDDQLNYSHVWLRRLTAEQLLDSQSLATGAPLKLKDERKGTRIAQTIEGRKFYKPLRSPEDKFLAAFGKPPRLVCSESERSNETTMSQVFQLLSGPVLNELLARPGNRLDELMAREADPRDIIQELYWATLARAARPAELESLAASLNSTDDQRAAFEDIQWALLNSKEFIFRR